MIGYSYWGKFPVPIFFIIKIVMEMGNMKKYEIYGVKYKGELVYIGKSAYGMCKRRSKHKYEAYTQKFKDNFHEFIRQVGFENLEWFVIEKCDSQHDIDIKEKEYIKKFNPKYNTQEKPFYCYNINGGYKYIGKFSNIYNTSKILNIDARKISAALQNEAITKEGYIFLRSTKNIKEEFFKRIHPYIYKRIGWEVVKTIYNEYLNNCKNKSKLSRKYLLGRKEILSIIKYFEDGQFEGVI